MRHDGTFRGRDVAVRPSAGRGRSQALSRRRNTVRRDHCGTPRLVRPSVPLLPRLQHYRTLFGATRQAARAPIS
jgi:hypothetical protein